MSVLLDRGGLPVKPVYPFAEFYLHYANRELFLQLLNLFTPKQDQPVLLRTLQAYTAYEARVKMNINEHKEQVLL